MAKEVLRNGSELEITVNNSSIDTKVVNSGFSNEFTEFRFRGRIKKNTPTVVGTLTLSPESGRSLSKKVSLRSTAGSNYGSNLKLRFKESVKDDLGNTTSSKYDLIYTAKESIKGNKLLQYSINSKQRTKLTSEDYSKANIKPSVHRIDYGKNIIDENGERRRITVYGDPGGRVKFTITKLVDSKDSNGNVLSFTEESILNPKVGNFQGIRVSDAKQGKDFRIDIEIPQSGKFSFLQTFPAITPDNTNKGVARYSVLAYPSSTKGLWNSGLWQYGDENSKLGIFRDTWAGYFSNILTQTAHVKMVLRATTTSNLYKINSQTVSMVDHDSDGGTATVQVYDKIFRGKPGGSHGRGKMSIQYMLEVVSGSNNLAKAASTIDFSNNGGTSRWSNSNYLTNGGTVVSITNVVVDDDIDGDTGNDKAKITFNCNIVKFGTKTTIMALPINNYINVS